MELMSSYILLVSWIFKLKNIYGFTMKSVARCFEPVRVTKPN